MKFYIFAALVLLISTVGVFAEEVEELEVPDLTNFEVHGKIISVQDANGQYIAHTVAEHLNYIFDYVPLGEKIYLQPTSDHIHVAVLDKSGTVLDYIPEENAGPALQLCQKYQCPLTLSLNFIGSDEKGGNYVVDSDFNVIQKVEL